MKKLRTILVANNTLFDFQLSDRKRSGQFGQEVDDWPPASILKIFGNTLWCLLRCYKLWPRPCPSVIEAWRLHLWKRCWGLMISVHSGVFVRQTVIPHTSNLSCNRVLRVLTLPRWVPLPSGLEKATKESAGHTRNKNGAHIGRFAFSFRPNVTM